MEAIPWYNPPNESKHSDVHRDTSFPHLWINGQPPSFVLRENLQILPNNPSIEHPSLLNNLGNSERAGGDRRGPGRLSAASHPA